MATVAETVRDLIATFPCSFENRTQALHHVLVVLGSGYEWQDGEAVRRDSDSTSCVQVHEKYKFSGELLSLFRGDGIDIDEEFITGRCPAEARRAFAAELALTAGPLGRDPYPPSTGVLLLTVPDNAAPDWALAAAEIAAVVRPLWQTKTAYAEAFEATLTPDQRQYVNSESMEALKQFDAAFGPDHPSTGDTL
ncbi:hypothetical protein [Streptomyces niveus]|uniref:hypothetical protein n=1 Tax=Streptomyces niveus TaxID=193462 RepID=UPI0034444152